MWSFFEASAAHVGSWFATLDSAVCAALISAAATIIAASLAAVMVLKQIGRQAKKARDNDRLSTEMKLKLKIYEENVLPICRAAFVAQMELRSFIRNFMYQIATAKVAQEAALTPRIPDARYPGFRSRNNEAQSTALAVTTAVEEWGIVDPRMSIFKSAMGAASRDVRETCSAYIQLAMRLYPTEVPDMPGKLYPWKLPSQEAENELVRSSENCIDALYTLEGYVLDFRAQMQQLLVGPLFPTHSVETRKPLDPKIVAIDLNRYDELSRYFETETDWGKHNSQIIEDVKRANSSKGN